jgi:hypothetical protein
VTTIPDEVASEVGPACEEFVAAEAVVLGYLRAGSVTAEGFAQADAECRAMIAKLRGRLSGKRK